jgi:hypothetical protein
MKRSVLTLAVVGALALGACGGGTDSSNGPQKVVTDEDSGDNGVVIEDALAQAAVSTSAAGSAHMTMTLTMSVPGHGDVTIEAEGVSDFATGDSRLTIDQNALFGALGMSGSGTDDDTLVEMRIVDGTAYVHYPAAMAQFMGGKSWVSMSGNDELRGTSSGIGPFGQADPREYLDYLATVSSGVDEVGSERIGDLDTTHYHAVIEFDRALDELPDARLEELGIDKQTLTQQLDAMRDSVGGDLPVDVWIDGDGLLRRLSMDMSFEGQHMSMVMDLDEYGVDVAVEAPPADQVTDLSSALGDLGAAVDNYGSEAPAA